MSDFREVARLEIRNFIYEGLKDVQCGHFEDYRSVFDRLEERYSKP